MRIRELTRTTTFRLSALYGLVFIFGAVALLGLIYLRSAVYLTRRVDNILAVEAASLAGQPPALVGRRIDEELTLAGARLNLFALFTPEGRWMAGNLRALPPAARVGGPPVEIGATAEFPAPARLILRRLPDGDLLAVGRDAGQLQEMRGIIGSALGVSGLFIIVTGLACGVAFSLGPLQRLRQLQDACADIAAGDFTRRMPVSPNHDELDMFAATVNHMMGEVERLMSEVRGATETIAHDLRTPLTRARAQLHRLQQAAGAEAGELARVTAELDEVLERFRALMRITELESRARLAGFAPVSLSDVVTRAADLYGPLAEASGLRLEWCAEPAATVEADPKLLFEAVSNLVDNAIKFSGEGGAVSLRLGGDATHPQIIVEDDGPGIPAAEKTAVLGRFYRGERDRLIPGSGLGLSVVAAIVRLHRFQLRLLDAEPGLRAVIDCTPPAISY